MGFGAAGAGSGWYGLIRGSFRFQTPKVKPFVRTRKERITREKTATGTQDEQPKKYSNITINTCIYKLGIPLKLFVCYTPLLVRF